MLEKIVDLLQIISLGGWGCLAFLVFLALLSFIIYSIISGVKDIIE